MGHIHASAAGAPGCASSRGEGEERRRKAMKDTFEQGWSARPFKEQFPELTAIEAQKLDAVNEAISTLYFDDMLTDSQLDAIRTKKFPRLVSKAVSQARKEKGEKQ